MTASDTDPGGLRGLRKAPQQARSRARVRAIYAAAEHILATAGVDALTMRGLAEDAGVPVGTLYQFFADKSAVLDAVVQRHMDTFDEAYAELLEAAERLDWRTLVDTLLDRFIERSRQNPAYVAIWVGHHLSVEMQRADDANIEAIAGQLVLTLVRQEQLIDSSELATACRVAVQTADALLQLAFRLDRSGDPDTLAEARRIQHLYLDDIAANPRYRRPTGKRRSTRATTHATDR